MLRHIVEVHDLKHNSAKLTVYRGCYAIFVFNILPKTVLGQKSRNRLNRIGDVNNI